MKLSFYQVDAFSDRLFGGNPAGVCPLKTWLPDRTMQKIAFENNLAETAFVVPRGENFEIRWFTPLVEVDLCGHATLASAHVLFNHLDYKNTVIEFSSKSGQLIVGRDHGRIFLDFPADFSDPASMPEGLSEALGLEPLISYKGKTDYMLIYRDEEEIRNIKPNFTRLSEIDARGIIVSAPGKDKDVDFVSRFFAPRVGVNEDPVTGSAHTTLIPYWSRQLVKTEMKARQLSARGGELWVSMKGNRVEISGHCVTYLSGEIELSF